MSKPVLSDLLVPELCDALGISKDRIVGFELRFAHCKPVRIVVVRDLTETDGEVIRKVLERYTVVERTVADEGAP